MRKAYKNKSRSCALCKPHKQKRANRWKLRDADSLRRSEKQIATCQFED